MYPITQAVLDKFQSGAMQTIRIGYRNYLLSNEVIIQGSVSLNRYCATGESVSVGSCVASEFSFTTLATTASWFQFEGKKLTVSVGVTVNNSVQYIPLGAFTVDSVRYEGNHATVTALDDMVNFDKAVDSAQFTFPYTLKTLLARICNICGVTLGTTGNFTNYSYSVTSLPPEAQ